VEAIRLPRGCAPVLGWESTAITHRSVVTFAGQPDAVVERSGASSGKSRRAESTCGAPGRSFRESARRRDPFVPLDGSSMADCGGRRTKRDKRFAPATESPCISTSRGLASGSGVRYRTCAGRNSTERRRSGRHSRAPHSRSLDGGRPRFLVRSTFVQDSERWALGARQIARKIREASGGFKGVRAIGLYLDSSGRAQVSMNLVPFGTWRAARRGLPGDRRRSGHRSLGIDSRLVPRSIYEASPEFFSARRRIQ